MIGFGVSFVRLGHALGLILAAGSAQSHEGVSSVAQFHLILLPLMFSGVAHGMQIAMTCSGQNTIKAGV